MQSSWSRRSLLTTLSVTITATLAGCTDLGGSSRGATDIVLHNEAKDSVAIELLVTSQGSDSAVVDTSISLEPNTRRTINNEVIMGSDYEVEVTFTSDSTDSPYTETQQWDDAGQPLHVIIHDQIVFAVQVG